MVSMFESIITILVAIFSFIFACLYFYFTRNFKFWQKLGIPYVKPTPLFGNFKECVLQKMNIGEKLRQIYNEHSDKPYVGIFSFDKPGLLVWDLEVVKNVLVKDSQYFMDRVAASNAELDPIFSNNLFMVKGQLWRHLRTNLTPVLSSSKIKKMFYLVDTCGKELAECLDRATVGGSTVDVADTTSRYTIDVIASCAFGINSYSLMDPQAEFGYFARKIIECTLRGGLIGVLAIYAPALASFLRLKLLDDDTNNYLRKTVWSTVEYRSER